MPIAQPATGDRNAYDRYWFNGYQDDGEFYFGIGAALYPNLGILDCGLSIVRDGEQHAFHASRRAPLEPTDLDIGPFSIEILEPMRTAARHRRRQRHRDLGRPCCSPPARRRSRKAARSATRARAW